MFHTWNGNNPWFTVHEFHPRQTDASEERQFESIASEEWHYMVNFEILTTNQVSNTTNKKYLMNI